MNYLPVNVYSHADPFFGDCTNGGVTVTHTTKLVVPCEDGHITEEDVKERGYVKLVWDQILNCPNFKPEGVEGWLMMGGNFVYSSDGRFSRKYGNQPIQVHDRLES